MENTKLHFIKRCAILITIVSAVMFGVLFISASNCYAKTTISDEHVTAVVNDDGISGSLYFNDDTYYKEIECPKFGRCPDYTSPTLTSIDGIPLKNIVKFKNGGYVSSFKAIFEFWAGALSYYNWAIVTAAGPTTFFNKGDIVFYDSAGKKNSTWVWWSTEHRESVPMTRAPKMIKIVRMDWY